MATKTPANVDSDKSIIDPYCIYQPPCHTPEAFNVLCSITATKFPKPDAINTFQVLSQVFQKSAVVVTKEIIG